MARAWRGHPFVYVPAVDTRLSSRRVLVTELLEGRRFEAVKALGEAERDRFGEIVFRFFFGTLLQLRRAAGDPHPGNYLLLDDGRVGFLDFGLMRVVDADYLAGERALAQAVIGGDADGVHRWLSALGYLPDPAVVRARARARAAPDGRRVVLRARLPAVLAELRGRPDGARLLAPLAVLRGAAPRDAPAAGAADPPHGGPAAVRARRAAGGRRLGARSAREYFAGAAPTTPLGEQDAAFWLARGAAAA